MSADPDELRWRSAWAEETAYSHPRILAGAASALGVITVPTTALALTGLVSVLAAVVPVLLAPAIALVLTALMPAVSRRRALVSAQLGPDVSAWPTWTLRAPGLDMAAAGYFAACWMGDLKALARLKDLDFSASETLADAARRLAPARTDASAAPRTQQSTATFTKAQRLRLATSEAPDPASLDLLIDKELERARSWVAALEKAGRPRTLQNAGPAFLTNLEILQALLSRTDLTGPQQERLLTGVFTHLAATPALGKAVGANPTLDPTLVVRAFQSSPAFAPILAASPCLSPELATVLSIDEGMYDWRSGREWSSSEVSEALAANPSSPTALLTRLAQSYSAATQRQALLNPSTPRSAFAELPLRRLDDTTLGAVLGHDHVRLNQALENKATVRCTHQKSGYHAECKLGHFLDLTATAPTAVPLILANRLHRAHQKVVELSAHHQEEFARDALRASRTAHAHLTRRLELARSAPDALRKEITVEVTSGTEVLEDLATSLATSASQDPALMGARTLDDLELVLARAQALEELTSTSARTHA